jgi:serine/threonine protein kinase
MSLTPETRLGPYEILEPLGAGGMGEVYKARDTRLGREVAIKILPAERVADRERKRRFIQEARAASALNHPNIITVHDISHSGGTDFLVMEYVRGRTIDQLIGRSGMRVSEALRYAIQIADALAKAHSVGIIHRDLKPGNVMLNEDGVVKVLDFGLAKLAERDEAADSQTTLTTDAGGGPKSAEGTIVGTLAYMSPEQAQGQNVDARSDIFSFGSMLYEMVTGRRAFAGNSPASTLAAVLKEDPRPPAQLVEAVPKELERIILRCLRKDPARRFHVAADLKVELEEVKEESDSAKVMPKVAVRYRFRLSTIIGATAILLAAALILLWHSRREVSLPAPTIIPLSAYQGQEQDPSFSPDGNQVVFAWNGEKQDNWDIYVKVVGSGVPLRLTVDPATDRFPAWSADGRYIAFQRGNAIFLISPLGGGSAN